MGCCLRMEQGRRIRPPIRCPKGCLRPTSAGYDGRGITCVYGEGWSILECLRLRRVHLFPRTNLISFGLLARLHSKAV